MGQSKRIWATPLLLLSLSVAAQIAPTPLRDVCKEILKSHKEVRGISGRDGWIFPFKEVRHLSKGRFWGKNSSKSSEAYVREAADPLPAIIKFAAELKSLGIELYIMPMPPKAVIYPDKLPLGSLLPNKARDPADEEFLNVLRSDGINVIDLVPILLKARQDGMQVFCKQDSHVTGRACRLIARSVAAKLRKKEWCKPEPGNRFPVQTKTIQITGNLWRTLSEPRPAKEKVDVVFVSLVKGKRRGFAESNEAAPLLILGDSNCLVYHDGGDMLARGGGIFDHLAAELKQVPDLLGVRGSGATLVRVDLARRFTDPGYRLRKRAILWCFSTTDFTEAKAWKVIPLRRRTEK